MHPPQTIDQMNSNGIQDVKKQTGINNIINLNNNGSSRQTQALLKQYQLSQFSSQNEDYNELNNPEISLNLQNLIDDSQFSDTIFPEILHNSGKQLQNFPSRQMTTSYNSLSRTLAYMPQPVHSTVAYSPNQNSPSSDSNSSFGSDVPIKEEPLDSEYLNGNQNIYIPGNDSNLLQNQLNIMRNHQNVMRKSGKLCNKDSDEYRRKRIRNNIAVRKSREKANQRKREIEEKNRLLLKENERLNKQLDSITDELNMMKNLLNSFGITPEQLTRELGKQLASFPFTQLHL